MKRLLQLFLVLFIVTGLTTIANAQDITATATVTATGSVTPGNNLDFGSFTPGSPVTVANNDAGAGTFTVSGNGTVNMTFTLPSNLTNTNSDQLPISFGSTAAAWTDDGSTLVDFDPTSSKSVNLDSETSDGIITVQLGGTVTPSTNQPTGTYTNTITLTANFN